MGGGAPRVIMIAASLLASAGCRGDDDPAAGATEGSSSSAGPGPEGSESSGTEPTICNPGQARACYDGPPESEGVGACVAGQQACAADGQEWSSCAGQVLPASQELCETAQDDDCDGLSLCEPTLEWWQPIAGFGVQLAASDTGGVVLTGVQPGGDELTGLFVQELDAAGEVVWERSVATPAFQWPSAVVVDATGAVTISGTYEGEPDFGGGSLPPAFGYDAFAVRYTSDGEHVWSHAINADGYYALAVGPDGTTYLAGGYLDEDADRASVGGELFVVAIDATGELQWLQSGTGGFAVADGTISLAITEAGELAILLVSGGPSLELGGMPMPSDGWQPLLVSMGLDGSPLGYQSLTETAPLAIGQVRAFARPGGLMAVASVVQIVDEQYVMGPLLVGMDAALEPISQHLLVGENAWLQAAAPYPDGTTLLSAEFSGLFELGTIGVGVQGNLRGAAVAAIDDGGQARWVEVLYAPSYVSIASVMATPEGAVYLAGEAYGGTFRDVAVNGVFLAKLRP